MGMRSNSVRLLGIAALASMALAGCGGQTGNQTQYVSGGTITLNTGDYDTLNPILTGSGLGYGLSLFLYDRLVALDPKGKVLPYLATSYEATPTKYTFHIRPGVTCGDGTPLTPTAIKASLDYLINPKTGAFAVSLIFGANTPTVTADDSANTVTISLTQPFNDVLSGLATPYGAIVCPGGLKNPDSLKNTPSGSGPFVMSDSQHGVQYTLTARKGYNWGPSGAATSTAGFPATVIFKVINSDTTSANLLLSGGLNLGVVFGRDIDRLVASPSLQHQIGVGPAANGITFNESPGLPGSDAQVRRAVDLLVDAKAITTAENANHGRSDPLLINSAMECSDSTNASQTIGYDPTGAKALLAQDGYVAGADGKLAKNGKPLTVRIIGLNIQNSGPEYIGSQLDSVGITTKVSVLNNDQYLNALYVTSEWDVVNYTWTGPFTTPALIAISASGPTPPNGFNVGFINNPTFDSAVGAAESAPSVSEGCAKWSEAERALLTNADVKPTDDLLYYWFSHKVQFTTLYGQILDPFSLRITQ
jgi:peptide/nickel transport system substrate-binding protein